MSALHQAMSVSGALADQLSNNALNGLASRPSFFSLGAQPTAIGVTHSDVIEALSSSEDGIKRSLIIDMKDLVGDAVGNVRYPSYASPSFLPSPEGR
jgi:hypothetical protein